MLRIYIGYESLVIKTYPSSELDNLLEITGGNLNLKDNRIYISDLPKSKLFDILHNLSDVYDIELI